MDLNKNKRKLHDVSNNKKENITNKKIKSSLVFDFYTENVELISFQIINYLLKDSKIKLIQSSNGRQGDLYAIYNENCENSIAIQVKSCSKGGAMQLNHGTDQYKGMIMIFIDYHEDLYDKIINDREDVSEDDINKFVRYIAITPSYNLRETDICIQVTANTLHEYIIEPDELYSTIKKYFNNETIMKKPIYYWECLCKNKRHHIEYVNIQSVAYFINQISNIHIIPMYPVLPSDAFIKLEDKYFSVQFKTCAKYGNIPIHRNKSDGTVIYYKKNDFDLLCVHNRDNPKLQLFIPMQKLIEDEIFNKNEKNKFKSMKYKNYLKYEINVSSKSCVKKLKKIISDYNIDPNSKEYANKYSLPGFKYRFTDDFITKTYNRLTKYTHEELLNRHDKHYEKYKSDIDELVECTSKIKGWPLECPKCDYKSKQSNNVGRHIRTKHPEIVENYKVSSSIGRENVDTPQYQCSECLKKYLLLSSIRAHLRLSNNCFENDAYYINL